MAIIKCKMCGGDIELAADKTFGTCEYCGSTTTLPKVDDDQRAAAFNRGNHFRRTGEFDKALAVYERIVEQDDTDAEAHWCCALCRFGIEYVEDPATYEWLPTCHRASFDSFLEDVDYLSALEHSDGVTRRQYQKDAAKIAEVQRGILATSQKEEPFDVFICYKETDENGNRTVDSTLAQDIYYQLTEQGRRVFFARLTLEDKAGTEYEPYIFAALNSAKVMIAVGTKPEHFNAVWVKNEWSRFLSLMKKDRNKLLLPCYREMDPYDLPEQLSVLQSYDMSKIGFIQDLIRGVSKVLDAEKAPVKQETVIVQSEGGGQADALVQRGYMALEDGEWKKADEFFEQALNRDAKNAEAYLGKALAERKCANLEQYAKWRLETITPTPETLTIEIDAEYAAKAAERYAIPRYLEAGTIQDLYTFDPEYSSAVKFRKEQRLYEESYWKEHKHLGRALRFAGGSFKEKLDRVFADTLAQLDKYIADAERDEKKDEKLIREKYSKHLKETDSQAEALYAKANEKRESDYQTACTKHAAAKNVAEYYSVILLFEHIGDYKDCEQRIEQCKEAIGRIDEENKRKKAEKERARTRRTRTTVIVVLLITALLAAGAVYYFVIMPSNEYKNAEALLRTGDYDGAEAAFKALGNYEDSEDKAKLARNWKDYQAAKELYEAGDLAGAKKAFSALGHFSDSADRVLEIRYIEADNLYQDGDYAGAWSTFAALGNYKDAAERCLDIWVENYSEITHPLPICAGGRHTVGLKVDGTVVAVGYNENGQCDVNDWSDIIAVAAGSEHTVGLKADGTVVAVGSNQHGQCDINDWSEIVAVTAGNFHTIGLRIDGTVVATGYNEAGQCNVDDWSDIIAVASRANHTVGLKADGTVVAVGYNRAGRCDVNDWANIIAVAAGVAHTVGLKANGTVIAIGPDDDDACDVNGWSDIIAVTAAPQRTVGLKSDGSVIAVGDNKYGQCDVNDWSDIIAVSAGGFHTVGLKADGTVVAVGEKTYGQLAANGWTDIGFPWAK